MPNDATNVANYSPKSHELHFTDSLRAAATGYLVGGYPVSRPVLRTKLVINDSLPN